MTARGCGGSCNQGHTACDCELANDVAPDASRTFAPLPYDPLPSGRTLAWTVLALALIAAGLLMLLAPGPAHGHALVWVGSR